ncbi:TPA: hypothetical protein ACNHD2_005400, partial [Klebsiella pneumoniae]
TPIAAAKAKAAAKNERPAFMGGSLPPVAFNEWDGLTGNPNRDGFRIQAAEKRSVNFGNEYPLRYVPPLITDAGPGRWDVLNHADNLRWMLYRNNARLELNLMTFRVELSSADGSGL